MPAELIPAHYVVRCDCENCTSQPEFAESNLVFTFTQLKNMGWKWYGKRWIHPNCSPYSRNKKGRFTKIK